MRNRILLGLTTKKTLLTWLMQDTVWEVQMLDGSEPLAPYCFSIGFRAYDLGFRIWGLGFSI